MSGNVGVPLEGGTLPPVPPNAPLEVQNAALNDVIDRLNGLLKSQTFSDGNTKRMIIGYQKDGWGTGKSFGIKISQSGVDVTQATDSQLLFKMDMATWRWYDSSGRNYVNIGRRSTATDGLEMAKPGVAVNEPAS